ncbi:MAG TPA: IS630 family transposase [Ktedonobacteraceae bacterium]|nr:IS630 family transposase [Ktedonobacteraceae bacterium]
MRAYSSDLRERVVKAVDQGCKRAEIIKLFGVSRATIKRYLKLRRETGQVSRKPIPGRPPKKRAALQAGLVVQLEAYPDATLEMHCQFWEQTSHMHVSPSTMSLAIRRMGWTRKKKTVGATERNEDQRAAWRERCKELDATQLVVLDECGSHIGLTPLYARAPRGIRASGKAPRNRGKNTTLIATLTFHGIGESMIIEGATTTAVFEQYVEAVLAPSLTAGQIVLLDNLAAHKGKRIEELITARGCQLIFLPSYSPDFSPIEETFSKLKTLLRRAGARTREALHEAIGQALLKVTAEDAQGWFRHCGYFPQAGG